MPPGTWGVPSTPLPSFQGRGRTKTPYEHGVISLEELQALPY